MDILVDADENIEKKVFQQIKGDKYVQIKLTRFEINNESRFMLQIIDISNSVLYDM